MYPHTTQNLSKIPINQKASISGKTYAVVVHQGQVAIIQLLHKSRCLLIEKFSGVFGMSNNKTALQKKLNQARNLFQNADVNEQHEVEAIRIELRLKGLFSNQPRPTSLAYESIVSVLFMQMVKTSEHLALTPTIISNPHKYSVPTALPRDLTAAVKAELLLLKDSTYSPGLRLHQLVIDTLRRVNSTKGAA